MARWYGNLTNRLEEDKMFTDEIKVGTGATEYLWSDRHAYEVIAVKDQKHVTIREYDHKAVGEPMSNDWELISNPDNVTYDLVKRGNYWYKTSTVTAEDVADIDNDPEWRLRLAVCGFDLEKIREKGKQTKLDRIKISFGVARYYYDYSF